MDVDTVYYRLVRRGGSTEDIHHVHFGGFFLFPWITRKILVCLRYILVVLFQLSLQPLGTNFIKIL